MKIAIFFLVLFHYGMLITQEIPVKYNIYSATLCSGDQLYFGNKAVKFKEVISDSRCPEGVTCIWAGEIKVLVEFYEDGKFKGDKIITGTNISIAEFFNVKDLEISGMVVSPYPKVNEKISPGEYSLKLQVSEKLESN